MRRPPRRSSSPRPRTDPPDQRQQAALSGHPKCAGLRHLVLTATQAISLSAGIPVALALAGLGIPGQDDLVPARMIVVAPHPPCAIAAG